jgi:hypothetical protein
MPDRDTEVRVVKSNDPCEDDDECLYRDGEEIEQKLIEKKLCKVLKLQVAGTEPETGGLTTSQVRSAWYETIQFYLLSSSFSVLLSLFPPSFPFLFPPISSVSFFSHFPSRSLLLSFFAKSLL